MIFRQLFDPETSSYSHLLGDELTREAVLIDSVSGQLERDVSLVRSSTSGSSARSRPMCTQTT
jgi:hypothetical protein